MLIRIVSYHFLSDSIPCHGTTMSGAGGDGRCSGSAGAAQRHDIGSGNSSALAAKPW